MPVTLTVTAEDAFDLIEPALRYALPRMTGISSDARGWLGCLWPALTKAQRTKLLNLIPAEFGKHGQDGMWARVDGKDWSRIHGEFRLRLDEPTVGSADVPASLAFPLVGALIRVAIGPSGYDHHHGGEPWHADAAASYRAIELVERYGVQIQHAHQIALYVREIADEWEGHPGYIYDLRESWLRLGRTLNERAHQIADSDEEEARFFDRWENRRAEAILERVI